MSNVNRHSSLITIDINVRYFIKWHHLSIQALFQRFYSLDDLVIEKDFLSEKSLEILMQNFMRSIIFSGIFKLTS